MLRKTILAIASVAALGTAALAPSSASAAGFHGHPHFGFHGFHHRFWGPRIVVAPALYGGECYYEKRLVRTPFGPRLRRIPICD